MKFYLIVSVIAIALFLQWYSHGGKLLSTDDSKHYIAGSKSFRSTFSLLDANGHHYLFWPPLFPVILSTFQSPENDLIWLNCVLTICIALLVLRILNRLYNHQIIGFLCFVYILLGVHLLLVATFLWSELTFIFLVLLFVDQLQNSKENLISLYMAIACGFLMCLQRNSGVFIVAGASIWVFINEETWKPKILKATFFFLVVSSGVLIWNVYVWLLVPHKHFTFSEELFQFAWVNTNSLYKAMIHLFLPLDMFPVLIFASAFFAAWYYMKDELRIDSSLQLVFILTIVYLAFISLTLIINVGAFPVDFGESDRFISVIVPFVAMIVFKVFEKVFNKQVPSTRIWITVLLLCWLCYPLTRTIKNAIQWHEVRLVVP